MTWVAEGGQVWDCQLAEYLLEGMVQQAHMLSLDEVAPRYGGQLKFDEVKALWQAGVQTDDIEPKLLLRYLCGEGTTWATWATRSRSLRRRSLGLASQGSSARSC
jgi:DNA polymerase-1